MAKNRAGLPIGVAMLAESEAERRRAGRALHRDVAPGLSAAILELNLLQREPPLSMARAAPGTIERALAALGGTVTTLRAIELSLRPPLLEEAGLGPPLRWLADQEAQVANAAALDLALPEPMPRLDPELEWQLYQSIETLVRRGLRPRPTRRIAVAATPAVIIRIRISGAPGPEVDFAVDAVRARLAGHAAVTVTGARSRRFALEVVLQNHARPPRTLANMKKSSASGRGRSR